MHVTFAGFVWNLTDPDLVARFVSRGEGRRAVVLSVVLASLLAWGNAGNSKT